MNDLIEFRLADSMNMTEEELDVWKETVRMDAIRIPHNAHNWLAESGSNFTKA